MWLVVILTPFFLCLEILHYLSFLDVETKESSLECFSSLSRALAAAVFPFSLRQGGSPRPIFGVVPQPVLTQAHWTPLRWARVGGGASCPLTVWQLRCNSRTRRCISMKSTAQGDVQPRILWNHVCIEVWSNLALQQAPGQLFLVGSFLPTLQS